MVDDRPAPSAATGAWGGTPPGTTAALDLSNADATGQVRFEASGPGRASTELWLHNRGQADLGQIQLRCSDLLTHDGHRIDSDAVQFDPEIVPMPARSSRGVTMEIAVTQEIPPGLYRGMVLVSRPSRPLAAHSVHVVCRRMTTLTGPTDLVSAVDDRLRDVAKQIRRSMLDAMPDGEPAQWLYAPMREYPSRPSKGSAPALCLAAGRVFGASTDELMGIAVAIELLHNAFLVHDDVADGSLMRRGRPTLSASHGVAAALNAGDGLAIVAGQVLRRATRRLDRNLADLVWAEFDTMAMRTLEGQATEIGWRLDTVADLRPEDYLQLILHKTCWYTTIHPLRVGAIIGSGGTADLAPLVRFGFHFGAAFQIRDDMLNLVGDERDYGKEILGDLYEGKRTLPLLHLLSNARGPDRTLVHDYLRRSRSERSPELVRSVRALMDEYGSIAFTSEYAQGILVVAQEYFEQAFADAHPGPDLDFLRALVPYVWSRWR